MMKPTTYNKKVFESMYNKLKKSSTNKRIDYDSGKDYKQATFRKINGEEITIRYEKRK